MRFGRLTRQGGILKNYQVWSLNDPDPTMTSTDSAPPAPTSTSPLASVPLSRARPGRCGQPADRSAFVSAVLATLQGHREIGLGLVHRVARECQRKFFDAPLEADGERRRR
jgi:hypothetical protein